MKFTTDARLCYVTATECRDSVIRWSDSDAWDSTQVRRSHDMLTFVHQHGRLALVASAVDAIPVTCSMINS